MIVVSIVVRARIGKDFNIVVGYGEMGVGVKREVGERFESWVGNGRTCVLIWHDQVTPMASKELWVRY